MPSGRITEREIVEHRGAVTVVALDEEENVLLVSQFRSAVGEELLELPAGTIEIGEDTRTCALRELQEETGYIAEHLEELYVFFASPGFSDERIWLYLATGLRTAAQGVQTDEISEVIKVPLDKAVEMIRSGEINDGKSILGLTAAQARLAAS
ncbi:MAG: NUDIX domain-containing protein [Anaerolineae bacterium]|nr:NUDIX domain-containing protein [Anaerolineae bacterium]NIN99430.1 NUDIX domain-containing protein [Anaerolineae bacterium]NIQ82295.1 NUDIX domain-containing protein [Anaerolineae bacterium]